MAKKWPLLAALVVSFVLFSVALAQGTPSIERWVIGGGDGSGSSGGVSLNSTMGQWLVGLDATSNRQLSSGFWQGAQCYGLSVTVEPAAGGGVSVEPPPNCGQSYLQGTVVTLTAVSNAGYVFDGWSGDAGGSANPINLTIDEDKSVTAHFAESSQPCYALNTDVDPSQGGDVSVVPAPNCSQRYLQGTVVTLTAVSNAGYVFDSWSGDAGGSVNPISLTVDVTKSVTARFELVCHPLSVTVEPAAGGGVSVEPPPNCGQSYLQGTVVTLTAVSNAGYVFDGWSGDAGGSANPINLTLDADKSVTAHFAESSQPCYQLSADADPSQGGDVSVVPAPNCSQRYLQGTVVTLTAVSNAGYVFDSWSGDAGGSANPIGLTMDVTRSVTAHFTENVVIYLPIVLRGFSP